MEKHEGFVKTEVDGKTYVFANPAKFHGENHALDVLNRRDYTRALRVGKGSEVLGDGNTLVEGRDVSTWDGFEIPS